MSKRTDKLASISAFEGFNKPESNFFRMPNEWIDLTASIDNIAELKVVQYILRHTWGYQEFGLKKRITIDEFIFGRKRKDASRLDSGTGLSEMSVRNGIAKALEHGFISIDVDDSDKARVKKYYSLKMRILSSYEPDEYEEVQSLESGVQTLDPSGTNFRPRSEKETKERNFNIRNSNSKLESNNSKDNKGYQGFQKMGDILKKKKETKSIPPKEVPEPLKAAVQIVSEEFGDRRNVRSNLTRVVNLSQKAKKNINNFDQFLYTAMSITKDQEKQGKVRNKMTYFFGVLEEQIGLKLLA